MDFVQQGLGVAVMLAFWQPARWWCGRAAGRAMLSSGCHVCTALPGEHRCKAMVSQLQGHAQSSRTAEGTRSRVTAQALLVTLAGSARTELCAWCLQRACLGAADEHSRARVAAVQGSSIQVGFPLVVEVRSVDDTLLGWGANLPDSAPHRVPSWQRCQGEALRLACKQPLSVATCSWCCGWQDRRGVLRRELAHARPVFAGILKGTSLHSLLSCRTLQLRV